MPFSYFRGANSLSFHKILQKNVSLHILRHRGSLTGIGFNFEENLPLRKKAFDQLPT